MQQWKLEWAAPLWTVVPACLASAGIAAIIEWQTDDSLDDDDSDDEPRQRSLT
jgi:hypothetical protein